MDGLSTYTGLPLRGGLAHRSGGIDVTLLWAPGRGEHGTGEVVVCVCDTREGAYFEIPTAPYLALAVSHDPFAYRHLSRVDYQDSRLAG